MTSASALQISVDDGIAVFHLDDGKANAVTFDVIDAFHAGLDQALADARAVVIHGRPGRFSAGFDLSVMSAGDKPMQDLVLAGAELCLRIYAHPQPVIAACTGHALAAGALLLLSADVRIGEPADAKIGLNEVGIGMPLPVFAVELARDRLDPRQLTAATLGARIYDPAGAAEVGYLDQVAAADTAVSDAMDEARRQAELRSGAIAATKTRLRAETIRRIRSTLPDDIAELSFG